jgi:predicted metalloprotease with PDZ domain
MKKLLLIVILFNFVGDASQPTKSAVSSAEIVYHVDVINCEDDLFHVIVLVSGLSSENNVYNLPATVPGTYRVFDFGRFVKTFNAYDKYGNELPAERISTNRWEIEDAENLNKIVYDVEDTFDAEVTGSKIMPMSGTGIENDFIVMNTFGVLGYFEGLQSHSVKLKIDYKSDWTIGTALILDGNGYYTAETYDHLADSPVLLGELTTVNTMVNDINVGVYVYSPDSTITAETIMKTADEVLQSSGEFIGYSPVTHYNFLFCLMDMESFQRNGFHGAGALEHSYSSLYTYPASGPLSRDNTNEMAHEFFHILTPLNLHSNIIQPFNFVVPTASQHIWLYEGVTEWASEIMQLRGGLITIDEYLERLSEKADLNERLNQEISLTQLSLEVYSDQTIMDFINFYNKGAVTAAFLDIRLLELSKGKSGLRELFVKLLDKYGKHKPFPEDGFFEIIVDMTYPEIEEFINDYLKDSEPLPYAEYMKKLGYTYISERPSEDKRPTLGIDLGLSNDNGLMILGFTDEGRKAGLREEDIILKVLGQDFNMGTARQIFGEVTSLNVGDLCELVIERDGSEIKISVPLQQRMDRHIFEEMDDITEDQKFLRDVWTRNL